MTLTTSGAPLGGRIMVRSFKGKISFGDCESRTRVASTRNADLNGDDRNSRIVVPGRCSGAQPSSSDAQSSWSGAVRQIRSTRSDPAASRSDPFIRTPRYSRRWNGSALSR